MRKLYKIFSKFIIFTLFSFLSTVHANNINSEINSYINNIKTLAIEFKQQDSNGNEASGMLILDKPHKFRCNYYAPYPLLIVGNRNYISIYDFEMKNLTRIKAKHNPFNFLLLDNSQAKQQFRIVSTSETNKAYKVRLQDLSSKKFSEVTFDKINKSIALLKIFEEDNIITLTFGKNFEIISPEASLFILKDPDLFGRPSRLGKKDLYKILGILTES